MSPPMYAIENVNVIPMDAERVLSAQTVITRNGRINNIGDAISTKIPAGAHRIDAAGQYLIPALADMHVHLEGDAWNLMFPPEGQFSSADLDFNRILVPYIANGVTNHRPGDVCPTRPHPAARKNKGGRNLRSQVDTPPDDRWTWTNLAAADQYIGGNPCRDSADSPYSLAGAALLPAGDTGLERCRVDHQRSPWWPTSGPPSRVQRHFMAALPVSLSAACQPIRTPFGYET